MLPTWVLVLVGLVAAVVVVVKVMGLVKSRRVSKQVREYRVPMSSAISGRRVLVLVNPHGGDGLAQKTCDKVVVPLLAKANCETTVVKTASATHAFDLAVELAENLLSGTELDHDAVLILSGDGMFCETTSGFVGTLVNRCEDREQAKKLARRLPMAPIPCGSSNGLATSLLSPKPFEAMAKVMAATSFGRPFDLFALQNDSDVDAGSKNVVLDCHFVNVGLVAEFDHICENKIRWMGRTLKPFASAIYVILRQKLRSGRIYFRPAEPDGGAETADAGGREIQWSSPVGEGTARPSDPTLASEGFRVLTGDYYAVSFCNADWGSDDSQYAPGIHGNDGTCGMVVMRPTTKAQLLQCFLKMEDGGHIGLDFISYYRADKFRIVPQDVDHMDLSGRGYPVQACSGEVLHGAMTILG